MIIVLGDIRTVSLGLPGGFSIVIRLIAIEHIFFSAVSMFSRDCHEVVDTYSQVVYK